MEMADIRGAVSKVGDRDGIRTFEGTAPSQAIGDRQARSDDAGGHHDSRLGVADVHRAALSLAEAGGAAGNLGPKPVDGAVLPSMS